MKPFLFTRSAQEDLFQIWTYIAQNDPDVADRIEAEILSSSRKLASTPSLGITAMTSLPDLLCFTPSAAPIW